MINPDHLLENFRLFGNRMFDVSEGNNSEPIVACPGWSVSDLMSHVGTVYGAVTSVIESGSLERPTTPFPIPPDTGQLEWAMGNFGQLIKVFEESDPSEEVWTWGRDQNIGFFFRRMTHETLLHMRDVEMVAGEFMSVNGDVACDGIDEYLDGALQHSMNPSKIFRYPPGSIHLHRTDGEGEWLIKPSGNKIIVTREHAKGDVAVRASAINLLLYLWGRTPAGLEIFGDPQLAEDWGGLSP